MMRKFLVRPTLVDERTMQRQLAEHQTKLKQATHAIDCLSPPTYSHLTCKLKKLQLEHERIWRIENENRRLLSRLAEIMNGRPITITSTGNNPYHSGHQLGRTNQHCTKNRGGNFRPLAAKGSRRNRPQLRSATSSEQRRPNDEGNDENDADEPDWAEQLTVLDEEEHRRPHTVAIMASRSQVCNSRPTSTVTFQPKKIKCRHRKKALCGCTAHPSNRPIIKEPPATPEPTPAPVNSPLNDVTDLLFGIQSVEITQKPRDHPGSSTEN